MTGRQSITEHLLGWASPVGLTGIAERTVTPVSCLRGWIRGRDSWLLHLDLLQILEPAPSSANRRQDTQCEGNARRPEHLSMAMEWKETGTQVLACAITLLLVSAGAVTLRLISRGRILHILGPTDWFMALTLVRTMAPNSTPQMRVR